MRELPVAVAVVGPGKPPMTTAPPSSSSGTQNSPTLARTATLASSTSANIRAQAPAASNVRRMLL